jgi:hypothetical protein
MQNAPIFFVGNFRDGDLPAIGCEHAEIVDLAAAGGIKSSAVEHHSMLAVERERFDHVGVEVVKKRIVIVKTISHWELSAVGTWNLAVGQELF